MVYEKICIFTCTSQNKFAPGVLIAELGIWIASVSSPVEVAPSVMDVTTTGDETLNDQSPMKNNNLSCD